MVRDKDGDLLKSPDFEEYVFVKYIFPFKGNEEAIGFNVYSNSKRKKALILAKERKSLEVTEKISLVQKEEKSNGLLVFYPVNSKINGFGYSTAVVVISELINKAVSNVSDGGLCLVIEDRTAKKDSTLYKSGCEDLKDSIIQKFKVNKVFKIGSREWEFIVYPKGSYILKNLSGSSGFILIISSVLTGILGMLILIVTGREKVINQVVKGRTKELEKANKIKSEFLANMSHEIRTPMNGVLGMLTLLETTNINDEQKEYLEDAKNSVVALLTIINDILDVSKLESKKIEIIPIKMDVIKLCNNILQLFRLEGIKKNIQLRFVFNKKVNNYFIQADENRLRQILINLVGNAIKFTTKGSIELNVSVDENNKRIEFSVKDTGIGISEEDIRKLFDRFVQLESSRTKKFEGAGLGLYISKQLIVLMGGNIQIQSEVSKGSNFHFHIPLIKSDVNLEKEIKDTNLIKKKTEPNSFNILIAEDNPINQKFIKKILEKNGYQLDIANNGLEVIHILDNSISGNRFDLILMDIQMPEMDGLSATKLIRQRKDIYSEIPILALTANTMEPQVKEYLENGMNGCIKKPIILEDLISEINRWERTQKIKKPLS
ncbi:MAG: response regulator [Leptospiraceae bacterium]|nr:response regulator [Leptospiraceae bacterium]